MPLVTLPGEVLPHGGLQILHHVEAGVLAQERVAKERNEIGGRMTNGNVVCRQPRGLRDLLAVARRGTRGEAGRRGLRVIAAGQASRRYIEVTVQIHGEHAVDSSPQAEDLGRSITLTCSFQQLKGCIGVAEGVVRDIPVRLLVSRAEMGDTPRASERDRPRDIGWRSAVAYCRDQALKDRLRIIAEKVLTRVQHGSSSGRGPIAPA